MATDGVRIAFFADLRQFRSQMDNVTKDLKRKGKQFKKAGSELSKFLTLPLAALGAVSIKNYGDQANAIAQVEIAIKSTGGAARKTLEDLQDLASNQQANSLFGDEKILTEATANLLTFTNVADNAFDRTQQVILDFAARTKSDLKSATIQFGKALNDPVANLSALGRAGIQFTKQQKDQINALVKSGKLYEAQSMILDELEKQYGGSAAAAVNNASVLKQLSNLIGDLSEDFGRLIAEAMRPFIDWLKSGVIWLKGLSDSTKKIILIVGGFVAALGPLLTILGFMMTNVIPGLVTAFAAVKVVVLNSVIPAMKTLWATMLANPITAILTAVGAVTSAFLIYKSNIQKVSSAKSSLIKVEKSASQEASKETALLRLKLAQIKKLNIGTKARMRAINQLKNQYPEYLGHLDSEKATNEQLTTAIDNTNNAIRDGIILRTQQEEREKLLNSQAKRLLELDAKKEQAKKSLTVAVQKYGLELNKELTVAEQLKQAYQLLVNSGESFSGNAVSGQFGDTRTNAKKLLDELKGLSAHLKISQDNFDDSTKEVDEFEKKVKSLLARLGVGTKVFEDFNESTVISDKSLDKFNKEALAVFQKLSETLELPEEETIDFGFDTEKIAKTPLAVLRLNEALELANRRYQAQGDLQRLNADRATAYQNAIDALIEKGLDPQSDKVQNLVIELESLRFIQEQNRIETDLWNTRMQALGDVFNTIADNGIKKFSDLLNIIKQALVNALKVQALNAIQGKEGGFNLGSVIQTVIGASAGGLLGGAFNFLSGILPKFGNGGRVYTPQLAIVGDQASAFEDIVPSNQRVSYAQSVLGGGISPNLNAFLKVRVEGNIRGQDINISNTRFSTNKQQRT